ncbi:hypothetical protein JK358_32510 [Nocardia sp. 2]|uniref:Uncharacterized protein n=1 Tax=Nocardia acididurans TaxID=2802282 RepID=A0ABS1MES0_9NOCA|nr:S1 family peptidase [Nocardia acididurans]MBL1079137.1 hypothetical protein [Nocardia acididurans]
MVRLGIGASVVLSAAGAPTAAAAPGEIALPDLLVEAVARDLELDAGGYLARADLAQRLADFETTARLTYPDVFAGVRMDGGQAIVALAAGMNRDHARKAVGEQGFTVEEVTWSAAALLDRRRAVAQWITAQPAQVTAHVVGDSIDIAGNTVVLRTTGEVRLPAELGPVRVETAPAPRGELGVGTPAQQPISAQVAGAELTGGSPISIPYDQHLEARCSLAFHGSDGAGNTVTLTAGHCAPDSFDPATVDANPVRVHELTATGAGAAVGRFTVVNNDLRDFAIIRIDDAHAARFQNNRVSTAQTPDSPAPGTPAESGPLPTGSQDGTERVSDNAQAQPIRPAAASDPVLIDGVAAPVVGAPVCKSGAITGFTCGTITEVDQTYYSRKSDNPGDLKRLEGFFGFDTCGIHGDSGGSVITGTKALGIVSGSGNADRCEPRAGLTAQPIDTVIAENPGLQLRTS